MSRHWFDHHPPCPGGCNQLADECTCPRPNPLGSMRIVPAIGSAPIYVATGIAAFERTLQEAARTDLCYRCDSDPAGRIDPLEPEPGLCRACLDEVSHAAETRRYEDAWTELANDATDGGGWGA